VEIITYSNTPGNIYKLLANSTRETERIGMLSSNESTGNCVCPRWEDASSNRIFEEQNNHVGLANQVWIFETT
jgi:hypothetical protein